MTNTTLFKTMIDRYNNAAFTHEYIYGFTFKGNVYFAFAKSDVMPFVCKLDYAGRGNGYSVRFCPTNAQKMVLMPGAQVLCSVKYFESVKAESKYNRGEVFEKMITEHFGQAWVKDNVPFTEAGDIEVNGIAYQIKYERATFCNEKSIANLAA